jgi:predicted deacylase
VAGADYLVDIHSGGDHDLLPHARVDSNPAIVLPLVSSLGLQYLVTWNPFPRGLLVAKAAATGVIALALEYGRGNELLHRRLQFLPQSLRSLTTYLGITHHTSRSQDSNPKIIRRWQEIRSPTAGLFIPNCKVGHTASPSQCLARILPFSGDDSIRLSTATAGLIIALQTPGPVSPRRGHLITLAS